MNCETARMFVYPLMSKLAYFYHKANSFTAHPQPLLENLLVVISIFSNSFCVKLQLVWQIEGSDNLLSCFPAALGHNNNKKKKTFEYLNSFVFICWFAKIIFSHAYWMQNKDVWREIFKHVCVLSAGWDTAEMNVRKRWECCTAERKLSPVLVCSWIPHCKTKHNKTNGVYI